MATYYFGEDVGGGGGGGGVEVVVAVKMMVVVDFKPVVRIKRSECVLAKLLGIAPWKYLG